MYFGTKHPGEPRLQEWVSYGSISRVWCWEPAILQRPVFEQLGMTISRMLLFFSLSYSHTHCSLGSHSGGSVHAWCYILPDHIGQWQNHSFSGYQEYRVLSLVWIHRTCLQQRLTCSQECCIFHCVSSNPKKCIQLSYHFQCFVLTLSWTVKWKYSNDANFRKFQCQLFH